MISGVYAALSGLQAYSTRMANNANNVANMNTDGFKRDRVILSTQAPQGVRATVEKVSSPGPVVAEATDQGYEMIEQSNVDLSEEVPEFTMNQHGHDANVRTIQAADQMMQSLLDLKA